jgi:inositol transport system ATP-binding protein
MALSNSLLVVKDLSLSYSEFPILKSIDLTLEKGQIHALVGENGAGKSSLFKCIMGISTPSSGEILFQGKEILHLPVYEVLKGGISMIHQELMLIPELTVAENIFLGREFSEGGMWGMTDINDSVQRLFDQYGLDIPVDLHVKELSIANQQIIEIMRSVSQGAQLILMDEPTSSLTDIEVAFFVKLIRNLRDAEVGIIFTSHKMDEIFEFSDMISVLRDGEMVGTFTSKELDANSLVQKMVGRDMADFYPSSETTPGAVLLEVANLGLSGVFEGINLRIRAGEVLGLAGLIGAGRTDIGQSIFGIKPHTDGKIKYLNNDFSPKHPSEAIKSGMAYLGEDRKEFGIIPEMPVSENMTLGLMRLFQKFQWILTNQEQIKTQQIQEDLHIRMKNSGQKINELSGGNQQKVLFGRMLINMPQFLILDEPTRGIDVVSKFDLYQLILEMKKEGKGILLISSDMNELLQMSDRIVVISNGQQRGEFAKKDATPEGILQLALKD